MRKGQLAGIVIALVIMGILATLSQNNSQVQGPNVTAMRNFLESQYVPEAELLRASVTAYPDNVTIWLANDNLLAERALKLSGSPLWKNVSIALSAYNVSFNGRIDPLLGRPLSGFFCPEVVNLGRVKSVKFNATFELKLERGNLSCRMRDWQEYADLLVYGALSDLLRGNRKDAQRLYSELMGLWDGNGFRDKAFNGTYQAYKCALFIYLNRELNTETGRTIRTRCLKILSALQAKNGGITTGYVVKNGKIVPVGDQNTETTSMAIIALLSRSP